MNTARHIGRYVYRRHTARFAQRALARPFTSKSARRYAVIYEPDRIPFSQTYPFTFHAAEFEHRHGVQLRFFTPDMVESLDFSAFDTLLLQLWFERDSALFETVFEKAAKADVEIKAFLDSFAHNDMRLAPLMEGKIRYYLRKSLYRDRGDYLRMTRGHTNLCDYYNRFYGLADADAQWEVSPGFLDKLRLFPNFFTAPHLCRLFLERDIEALLARPRSIDVHARLGVTGAPWYSAMRQHAVAAVSELQDVKVLSDGLVRPRRFATELMESRMCFSPFGHGEICWRDIEAIVSGAVMLKPSMDHLETLPNLYEPYVTYIPVAWDFSDLAEKVAWVLANAEAAEEIARIAFKRVQKYLETQQFVDDMGFLFMEEEHVA